jgi:hypothetical protein
MPWQRRPLLHRAQEPDRHSSRLRAYARAEKIGHVRGRDRSAPRNHPWRPAALEIGALKIRLNAEQPVRSELPIVADLPATDDPACLVTKAQGLALKKVGSGSGSAALLQPELQPPPTSPPMVNPVQLKGAM